MSNSPDVLSTLAIDGGPAVRTTVLPYGRQWIDEADIAAVVSVMRSAWLTTGPKVAEFERAFASTVGTAEAAAVSSGTAALHAAVHALGIGPGDEVIVPAVTFAASANAVVYEGGVPVFADVDPLTLLVDPMSVERLVGPRTKAVVAVDFAGQPCDYAALRSIAARRGLRMIADACHALGARDGGRAAGTLGDITAFSLHPVKHVTTGEGGMVSTDESRLAARVRVFRNHGITTDFAQRESQGSWFYEMTELGFNYRLTDIQCALGISQLRHLDAWLERRRQIARRYDEAFDGLTAVQPLASRRGALHAYHLYVVKLDLNVLRVDRAAIFRALRAEGIGVNVHYIPVHLHPFYRQRFGTARGSCPVAEAAYERLLSLPIFPAMSEEDVEDVIAAVTKVVGAYRR